MQKRKYSCRARRKTSNGPRFRIAKFVFRVLYNGVFMSRFCAPTWLDRISGRDLKTKTNHWVVDKTSFGRWEVDLMNCIVSCWWAPIKISDDGDHWEFMLLFLRDHAPRVSVVFVPLLQAGETVKSKKDNCGFATMSEKRDKWKTKSGMAK